MDQWISKISDISRIKDNLVKTTGNNIVLTNSRILFRGKNNILYIENGAKLKDCIIRFLGDNSVVYISKSNRVLQINSLVYNNSALYLGKNNSFNGQCILSLSERKHIIIGDDNMFSFNISIRLADPHLIYSAETFKRINPSESVIIGDHVWVGEAVKFLKGVCVGSGSIVAGYSVVTKKIPSNVSVAGMPARIIKKDIFWTRPCVHAYKEEDTEKSLEYKSDEFIYKKGKGFDTFTYINNKLDMAKSSEEKLEILLWLSNNKDKDRFFINEKNNIFFKSKKSL